MKWILVLFMIIACTVAAGCTLAQTPAKATLQFSTSPEGAQVYLDNQYYGTTPSTLADIQPGAHSLEFRYSGYQSWKANITVPSGASSYSATLTPVSSLGTQTTPGAVATVTQGVVATTAATPTVTIRENQAIMTIGSTQTFSGTCTGSDMVILMLYGPGAYTNGKEIARVAVGVDNTWKYVWNPGNAIMSGSYTMIAYDRQRAVSDQTTFSVVGGGTVSVVTPNSVVAQGNTASFSGLCTTGAKSVTLTLYGPGQFVNGVDLATLPLAADNTWSYRYTFDLTKPLGTYTISVRDAQNTASASTSFTLNSS